MPNAKNPHLGWSGVKMYFEKVVQNFVFDNIEVVKKSLNDVELFT